MNVPSLAQLASTTFLKDVSAQLNDKYQQEVYESYGHAYKLTIGTKNFQPVKLSIIGPDHIHSPLHEKIQTYHDIIVTDAQGNIWPFQELCVISRVRAREEVPGFSKRRRFY